MKANLIFRDSDFDIDAELPANAEDLTTDLELDVLFDAMADGDDLLRSAARAAVLTSTTDPETISYRQEILADCMRYPREARGLYDLIVEAIEGERKARWWGYDSSRYPSSILSGAVKIVDYYVGALHKLRDRARELAGGFTSVGLVRLCATLDEELSDEYLSRVRSHLKTLEFRQGLLISADLGDGLKGTNYVIRRPNDDNRPWIERVLSKKPDSYSYTVPERDDVAAKALSELRDRGTNPVANALAQSADHIRSFYVMLRNELAFYIGCLNLQERLSRIGEPVCLPHATRGPAVRRSFEGLYDVCLALTTGRAVVGNDVNADGRALVVITGANHGGKSTFLRSVGLSQLMMQCGMFVGASAFAADVCTALFTHFKRQEDSEMESGKLDEELKRMSAIADDLAPGSFVLFNESFAATNEREGSEIARQVVRALVENGVAVYFVTHQYDFASSMTESPPTSALFLRAERNSDGSRSYKLVQAPPLETSYGRDLYREVFGRGDEQKGDGARERRSLFVSGPIPDGKGNGGSAAADSRDPAKG